MTELRRTLGEVAAGAFIVWVAIALALIVAGVLERLT